MLPSEFLRTIWICEPPKGTLEVSHVEEAMRLYAEYMKKEYEEKLKNSIVIPDICICSCEKQTKIEMVYPIPPICEHCRMFIRRSFYNAT